MRRDIARVLTLSAVAQAAAFGKSILIAYYFGIGAQLDGYYLGQAIPAVVTGIVIGFLQTGFLTVYAGNLARAETHVAAALLGRTLIALTIIGTLTGMALSAAAPWLASMIAPDSSPSVQDAAVQSLRVLAFLLLLNGLVDCLCLALSAHGFFAVAAFAPTLNALVASALLAALPGWGLGNLIWGTLIGLLAQLVLVAIEMRRRRIKVRWDVRVDLRPVVMAGATIVPGLIFANLSVLVPQIIAARMGEGAVAAFTFAARLHGAATQVLAMALSTVLLPHFALAIGRGDHAAVVNSLQKGFPIVALISVAALLWVGLAGEPFVLLLFERGAFDQVATTAVSNTWFWLTVGLLPAIWGVVVAKVLQALRLGLIMSVVAFFSLLLTMVLSFLLAEIAGLSGLALAVGLSSFAATVALSVAAWGRFEAVGTTALSSDPTNIGRTLWWTTQLVSITFLVHWFLRLASPLVQLVVLSACVIVLTSAGTFALLRRLNQPSPAI